MMLWLRTSLIGPVVAALLLPAGVLAASPNDPPPAYAEVPAPRDTDFAIVPRSEEKRASSAYAIEAVPGQPASVPAARAERATLPDGPPSLVIIRFDAKHLDDAALAATLADELGHDGTAVTKVPLAVPAATTSIGFVFDEDEQEAVAIAHRLPGTLGRLEPRRINPDQVSEPRPGLIEITLGGEKGTS